MTDHPTPPDAEPPTELEQLITALDELRATLWAAAIVPVGHAAAWLARHVGRR